jgi:hypothetical protein
MNGLPPFLEVEDYDGLDYAERWNKYIEGVYRIYRSTIAFGNLSFRKLRVFCQFRPETFGKHYAFWHMMQEGPVEEKRTPDLERCRRVAWIGWVIKNAGEDALVRVFPQNRGSEKSWVLWLHEKQYAVILWERKDYYLLKTAFLVKPHKSNEFERDWNAFLKSKNG